MVGGHIIVERIRKDSIFVIEKEDEGEGEQHKTTNLSQCAHLVRFSKVVRKWSLRAFYDSSRHLEKGQQL